MTVHFHFESTDKVVTPIVKAMLDDLQAAVAKHFPDLGDMGVTVRMNTRMRTTAGRAWMRDLRIDMNVRLLSDNTDQIENTFAHELAHLITDAVYGTNRKRVPSHGWQWRSVMRKLGHEPTRTHSMDVAALKAKRRTWKAVCDCPTNNVHQIGVRILKKISQGSVYRCQECKSPIRPQIEPVPGIIMQMGGE